MAWLEQMPMTCHLKTCRKNPASEGYAFLWSPLAARMAAAGGKRWKGEGAKNPWAESRGPPSTTAGLVSRDKDGCNVRVP